MKLRAYSERGVTLMEVVIASLLLGIMGLATKAAMKILQDLQRQWLLAQVQKEAQLHLYNIVRDIRNCADILTVDPDQLVLKSYNFSQGYDSGTSTVLFDTSKMSTVRYHFVPVGSTGYLEREETFPTSPLSPVRKKIMNDMLIQPSVNEPLFSTEPAGMPAPYTTVKVNFKLGQGIWKTANRFYTATGMRRSSVQ